MSSRQKKIEVGRRRERERKKTKDRKSDRERAAETGDSVLDAREPSSLNRMEKEERSGGRSERERESKGNRDKQKSGGVSSTVVIRIHFMEMVPKLRKPASSRSSAYDALAS